VRGHPSTKIGPVRHLVAIVGLAALAAGAAAQAQPNFSGRWVSSPDAFTTVRNVPFERDGWQRHLSNVHTARDYEVLIAHAGGTIAMTFPGASNLLNQPALGIDDGTASVIGGNSEWWTKTVSRAAWDGAELTLRSTRFSGWWRDSDPAAVTTQPTQLDTSVVLALEQASDRLTMTVTVTDEKGTATYRQVFRRFVSR
jgi:hypothetical protein